MSARAATKILVLAAAAAIAAPPALAQSKTGTSLGQFLLIEPNARIAAMGNAGVALPAGLEAVYYNPAALGHVDGISVQFSHGAWLADIAYDHAAAAFPAGRWGNVSVSLTSLGSGEIDVRTVAQPNGTGERFTVSDLAIGLAAARRITDRFAAGFQITYAQETIWHSTASVATLSFGTLYEISDGGLRLGSSLTNFGTEGRFGGRDLRILYDDDPDRFGDNSALPAERFTDAFPVPVMFRVGLSAPRVFPRIGRLLVAVDAFHPSDNTESVSAGAEFAYRDLLALRCGYQNLFLRDSEVGLTAGGGITGTIEDYDYRVDYAWADHGRLGATHRVTFGMRF